MADAVNMSAGDSAAEGVNVDPRTDQIISHVADSNTKRLSHPLLVGFNQLPLARQGMVIGGIALTIALGIALFIWSIDPTYKPLIHRMQDHNAADIIDVLNRENIPFQIDPVSQVLMVESSDLHQARMKLASASLIDDKTVGMEVLEQDSALGTSQFIENARYRRGLEGELSRTIASVKTVRNARVHLALPKQSVFVRDQRKPRASVFLELYAGSQLSKDQVEAIVNLVASSVAEMDRGDVSVVDQAGNLLSKDKTSSEDMLATKQLEYTEKVENSITQAVTNILKPVLGSDNYKAEVSADIDFTIQQQSEELFNPDLIALRSEQVLQENGANNVGGGIPGALSNQPPLDGQAPEQARNGGEAGAAGKSRSEATRNYEVDRTLSYKQHQIGKLRRLTVAVVVNDKEVINADGDSQMEPWSAEDIQRLETLVKDAVGFNAARGDSVNVINSAFMGKDEIAMTDPDFWTQPWFWDVMKQVLAGVFILILIFGVIRPTVKSLTSKGRDETELLLEELEDAEAGLEEEGVSLEGMDQYLLPGASDSYEKQLEAIRGLIAEDPARVSQVVLRWVSEPDG